MEVILLIFEGLINRDKYTLVCDIIFNVLSMDSFTQQGIVSQGTTLIGAVAGERRVEVLPWVDLHFLWLFREEEIVRCDF